MYLEHGHVEDDRNENEAKGPGIKMFDPELRWDTQVSKQRPQLPNSLKADGSDGEQAHPLATDDCTERQTCESEPTPPMIRERRVLVFITKPGPKEDRERGEEDERRIEKYVSRLGNEGVLEDEEQ